MNRYSSIMSLLRERLDEKPRPFGQPDPLPMQHSEIITLMHEVLIEVADQEIDDMCARAFNLLQEHHDAVASTHP